jgi:hypothetical protein
MKLKGTIQYRDVEGGVWVFTAENGETYELAGGDAQLKRRGARIEAEGTLDRKGVSLGMVGPVFHVSRYKFR